MVVSLGPGKFYGSSLPRPRFYTDVKFNDERVDPPISILDPLLVWANEAHWSMGGLSFKRLHHQGRIEGSVKKLQAERESIARKNKRMAKCSRSPNVKVSEGNRRLASLTPPPAPIAAKKRKYMAVSDEEVDTEEEDQVVEEKESEPLSEEEVIEMKKKMPVRKLYDLFNKVARESKRVVESNGVGDVVMKVFRDLNKEPTDEGVTRQRKKGKIASAVGTRISPRLG